MRVRAEDIERLEEELPPHDKKTTIVIVVVKAKNRRDCEGRHIDIFAADARKRARSSGYNFILTDELNVYPDLIKFIKTHPLDSSNIMFFLYLYGTIILLLLLFVIICLLLK